MDTVCEMYGAPEPVSATPESPRVTFVLFAYNQEKYIREAVEGALLQKYDCLEVILSDDSSGDSTFSIMQGLLRGYDGHHQVRLIRNGSNLGLSEHVNRVLSVATGEIIVFAAGDDVSLPTRVQDTVDVFLRYPRAMAVSFSDAVIDGDGCFLSDQEYSRQEFEVDLGMFLQAGLRAQSRLGLSGASRAIRRRVFEEFGALSTGCPAEDTPYLRRALYLGSCIKCDWPAIQYRVHHEQLSDESSIANMQFGLFHKQYLVDLDIYRMRLAGSQRETCLARRHIDSEKIEFKVRRLKYFNEAPDFALIVSVFRLGCYSFRERLGLVKRFILRRGLD